MKKIILSTACALLLTTGLAVAQSSQGKGGAAMTGETADQSKTPGGMNKDNMGKNSMKKDNMGTSGMAKDKMGGANKNGDGQMTKGGMNK